MAAPHSHRADLTIAGVRFALSSSRPISGLCPSSAYSAFVDQSGLTTDVDVPIELVPHALEGVPMLERRFDAGDMWSLFTKGETRYIVHTGWGLEAPLWAAELTLDPLAVRIHCGGIMLDEQQGAQSIKSPVRYPLDQLLLTYVLASREGVILHAAGMLCGGRLWLLLGKSGAGKSTSSELLRQSPGMELLSDDRVVVRRKDGLFIGSGTPWPGEARIAANLQAPLAGLLFLEQAPENEIADIGVGDALERLMPVASVPWYEPDLFPGVIGFCGALAEGVPAYRLRFRPDQEAAELLARFVADH